ncbi:anthrax toxin lethal factor-related metalloendopeptidase [Bacillus sp. T3]|uniref:anthrax toxin lethal factor-related metalloendopeptidase n=1 Tax=Bacillus sp. T3 TaxID=467262 RepID=UPI0029810BAD|nr:toxin [Bacillus sp. T3]
MRKLIILVILIAFSVPLLGHTQAKGDGIALRDYTPQSTLLQSLQLRSQAQLGKLVYLPESDFDQAEASKIISRLDKLPSTILSKMVEEGIQLHLFEGNLTDQPTAEHLKGVIPRGYTSNKTWDDVPGVGGSKVVLVKIGASAKGSGHGSVNLELHELAHSIDRYVYDEIRSNPTYLKIWKQERNILFPGQSYFINYPEEYFAETFAMYYLSEETKEILKKEAPKTYAFFNSLSTIK